VWHSVILLWWEPHRDGTLIAGLCEQEWWHSETGCRESTRFRVFLHKLTLIRTHTNSTRTTSIYPRPAPRPVEFPVVHLIKYSESTLAHWQDDYKHGLRGINCRQTWEHLLCMEPATGVGQVVSQWVGMDGRWGCLSVHYRLHVHFTLSAITLYNLVYFLKNKSILMYSINMLINKSTLTWAWFCTGQDYKNHCHPPPCLK
jgi:hypothetical protein